MINKRTAVLLGLPVVLLALGWYSYQCHPYRNLQDALRQPAAFEGKVVSAGAEVTIVSVGDSVFVVRQLGREFRVRGRLSGAKPGEYVALEAIFHGTGELELVRGRVLKGRRAKIWISVLPLLIVVALFFADYRFDLPRGEFVRRDAVGRTAGQTGRIGDA